MKPANILQYMLVDTAANALLRAKGLIEADRDLDFADKTLRQSTAYLVAIRKSIDFDMTKLSRRAVMAFAVIDRHTITSGDNETIIAFDKPTKPTIH